MRGPLTGVAVAALLFSACGGSDDTGSAAAPDAPAATADGTDAEPTATGEDDATADGDTGDGDGPADTPAPTFEDVGPPPTSPDKPTVELPSEIPTELERTVLVEGTGEVAEDGDIVIVDYVGVRSTDGVEFDNSYDREPFPVTLGQGNVIQGWEDGLVGAQTGERVQLDIPSDLAYGEVARSDIIGENEALTFVIDVRSVVKVADADDAPTEPGVELSEGAEATSFEDLAVGEGDALEPGRTALIRYVNFRGDNGVPIEINWTDPLQVPFDEVRLLPGLFQGMDGMRVGGRRAITIPPEDGFGPEGAPQQGLPAGTDMIMVVELLGQF